MYRGGRAGISVQSCVGFIEGVARIAERGKHDVCQSRHQENESYSSELKHPHEGRWRAPLVVRLLCGGLVVGVVAPSRPHGAGALGVWAG